MFSCSTVRLYAVARSSWCASARGCRGRPQAKHATAAPELDGWSLRRLPVTWSALTFDIFGTPLDWRSTIASAFQESGLEVG
jgi:hypothetical protein